MKTIVVAVEQNSDTLVGEEEEGGREVSDRLCEENIIQHICCIKIWPEALSVSYDTEKL